MNRQEKKPKWWLLIVCGMVFIANKYIFSKIQLWQVIFFNNLVPLPLYTTYFQNRISVYWDATPPTVGGFFGGQPILTPPTPPWPQDGQLGYESPFCAYCNHETCKFYCSSKMLGRKWKLNIWELFIQIYSKLAFKYFSNNSVLNNMIKISFLFNLLV